MGNAMSPKLIAMKKHATKMAELAKYRDFYKGTINRITLERQRGISGAGLKSLSVEKAIDRLERLQTRLTDALRSAEEGDFTEYMKIADWVDANERQLKALKKSQRKKVNVFEFSYELMDAIKERVSLVDMADELKIRKKRSGAGRYVINCPFHDENTPSCMIYVNEDKFHCFGCAASGDVIDFYQKYLGIEFDEALSRLCERLNIQVMDAEQVERADDLIVKAKEGLRDVEESIKREQADFASQLNTSNNRKATA